MAILDEDVALDGVLEAFEMRFHSGVESGSFAERFARIRRVVEPLVNHPKAKVREWASGLLPRFDDWIERWSDDERGEFARFE